MKFLINALAKMATPAYANTPASTGRGGSGAGKSSGGRGGKSGAAKTSGGRGGKSGFVTTQKSATVKTSTTRTSGGRGGRGGRSGAANG